MLIELTTTEVEDLICALDYAAEDLTYRITEGRDFADDDALARERVACYQRLIERLRKEVNHP